VNDTPTFDLVLKGGHIIDPANDVDGPVDVAISKNQIARVAPNIPADEAARVLDVSGHYVTPGLIDIHTHVYTFRPTTEAYVGAMNADAHLLASGVTTTVDAGTAGWVHWEDFKTLNIDRSTVRILAFLNIASGGMVDMATEQDPSQLQPKIAAALAEQYPDTIVGIKTAHYWTKASWDDAHPPWASVERAVEAGELCGKPVMVDFWPRPPRRPYPTLILEKLRPGDIHTHVFAQQFPIIDERGHAGGRPHVYDHMWQARERGVIFDLGHGAGSFWFRNAQRALDDGFAPDSISTDLHMGNINGPVVSMIQTMSKFLCMGMPLSEVIYRSTVTPAREIGRPDLGTLGVGAEADVAVMQKLEGRFGYADCGKAKLIGDAKLENALTIRAGKIVYDPTGLSMPEWKDAPPPYWKIPTLQT
jgi:dihydroorotase